MGTISASDPYLDAGMEGFIRNLASKEYWRVADWYGRDRDCGLSDLIQDGYLCYVRCRKRYVEVLGALPASPGPDHVRVMQKLVRTTFERHIRFVLAGKMRWGHEEPISQLAPQSSSASWEDFIPAQSGDASLVDLLLSMPSELRQLVAILVGDGAESLGFERSRLERCVLPSGSVRLRRRGNRRLRETTNEYFCRLLGCDPSSDVRGHLQSLLRGASTP